MDGHTHIINLAKLNQYIQ